MKSVEMKIFSALTMLIVILGGINWGLVGIFEFDVITAIFGDGNHETAPSSVVARVVYVLIGFSAFWQFSLLIRRLLVPVDPE